MKKFSQEFYLEEIVANRGISGCNFQPTSKFAKLPDFGINRSSSRPGPLAGRHPVVCRADHGADAGASCGDWAWLKGTEDSGKARDVRQPAEDGGRPETAKRRRAWRRVVRRSPEGEKKKARRTATRVQRAKKRAGGVLLSHGRVPHYPRRWSP